MLTPRNSCRDVPFAFPAVTHYPYRVPARGSAASPYERKLARFLRDARMAAGLTQGQMVVLLNEELGTARAQEAVSKWEAGVHVPSGPVVFAWLRVTGHLHDDPGEISGEQWQQVQERMARLEEVVASARALLEIAEEVPPSARKDQYATLKEAQTFLGITRQWLLKRIARGHLTPYNRRGQLVVKRSELRQLAPSPPDNK